MCAELTLHFTEIAPERRRELAEVVWHLIREEGIQGVTLRRITAQSGWSSGAIRHYLPDREAILLFAARQVTQRIEARVTAMPRSGDLRQDFLAVLCLLLPLDLESRTWMEVWLAFVGLSASDPQFSDTQGVAYTALNGVLRRCFGDLERLGWRLSAHPERAATELHALLDGLSVHLLLGQIQAEQAREVLSSTLERMVLEPVPTAGSGVFAPE